MKVADSRNCLAGAAADVSSKNGHLYQSGHPGAGP